MRKDRFLNVFFALIVLISFQAQAQEKRLALVIGNSNYEKGYLKNPVNDALLMKETFLKLGFEVVLVNDIETYSEFLSIIDNFNNKRKDYSVGFIYYAGHAVQIDGVNYMLATKEKYESESNIKYKGVNISIFTDEWENPYENELNVLILDACRNNPFEIKIYGNNRAIGKEGLGLAEIDGSKQPTGSIVAFSTAAGKTASDGKEGSKNSLYCQSLSTNLQLEDVSIRNIFGKVSKEIFIETNQYPVISDKMFDVDFYLKKSTYIDQIIEIDSLIDNADYTAALVKVTSILTLDPNNMQALLRKGRIQYNTIGEGYNGEDIEKAIKLYPNAPEVYIYNARYFSTIQKNELALININKAIELDSTSAEAYSYRGWINIDEDKLYEGLADLTKAIELDSKNSFRYQDRANFYSDYLQDYNKALLDFTKAIELEPENSNIWYSRGVLYTDNLIQNESAIKDFEQVLKIAPNDIDAINAIGLIYEGQGEIEKAIKEYEKGIAIAIENTNPESAAYCYSNRANLYQEQNKLNEALADYTKAIELDSKNSERYQSRAFFYTDYLQDYNKALLDFTKAIELEPENSDNWFNRGMLYTENLLVNESAIKDFEQGLKIAPDDIDAINAIGLIYEGQGEIEKAIKEYEKGIAIENTNPESASYCYSNRANLYQKENKLNEALADYSKAIKLDSKNPLRYQNRADFYAVYLQENNKALLDYSKAIELEPANIYFLYSRGRFYKENLKDEKSAIKDFEQVLKISPGDIAAINYIGIIYKNQGEIDLAMKEYEKGIAFEKDYPLSAAYCYSNRAILYIKINKFERALEDFSKAIELDPKNALRYSTRAIFFEENLKDYNQAILDYSNAIYLMPNDESFFSSRAAIYFKVGDISSAIKDFQQALVLNPENIGAANNLGVIYKNIGEINLAIIEFEKVIGMYKLNPPFAAFGFSNRADIYCEQNILDKALSDYNKAIELDPSNSIRYLNRALFYKNYFKDFDNALADYTKALELDPNNENLITARAAIYFKLNDSKSALDDYNFCVKTFPNNQSSYNKRGLFYGKTENYEKAEHDFEKAIKLDSNDRSVYYYRSKMYILKKGYELAKNDLLKSIEMDDKDPEGYYYLAEIYELQGKYFQAIKYITLAMTILEDNKMNYHISDMNDEVIPLSFVYYKSGNLYEKLKENEMMCVDYRKSLQLLEKEFFPNKEAQKTILLEKIQSYCSE